MMNLSTTNYILTLLFTLLISNNNVVVSFAPHHHQLSSYTNTFQQKVKPTSSHRRHQRFMASTESRKNEDETPHVENILLVECGFGNDSHGQNATKAAMRACRNAIEFNSLSIKKMVPGGYDAMKLNVILGVPSKYQHTLDVEEVRKVFPYGDAKFIIKEGGLIAPSGRLIESLGDKNDDMLIVCAAVQVGY